MNRPAAAIVDSDVALRLRPGYFSSLYGRGLAKRRTGDQAGGDADIAAALKVAPGIAADFAKWGVRYAPKKKGAPAKNRVRVDLACRRASRRDETARRAPLILLDKSGLIWYGT